MSPDRELPRRVPNAGAVRGVHGDARGVERQVIPAAVPLRDRPLRLPALRQHQPPAHPRMDRVPRLLLRRPLALPVPRRAPRAHAVGRVQVANLRQAEVYEGYYHYQFTMLNACLLRSQTLSNLTFFFDVDEFLYIPEQAQTSQQQQPAIESILAEKALNNVMQILFQTIKVSDALCQRPYPQLPDGDFLPRIARKWAFEKLVYAKCDYGWTNVESRKYALQPRNVWATGVHYSERMKDHSSSRQDMDPAVLRSYHYHNSVNGRWELCKEFPRFPNSESNSLNVTNCTIDAALAALAPAVQRYELAMVGDQPSIL